MENTEAINELENISVEESIILNTVIEIPEETNEQDMSDLINKLEESSEQEDLINDNANEETTEFVEENNPIDSNGTASSTVSDNSVITIDGVDVKLLDLEEYSETFKETESMTSAQAEEMLQILSEINVYSSLSCFFLSVHLGYILSRFIFGRLK